MLCQNCQLNEATIHLYTNMNGTKKQNDLCQNCYQIMKAGGRENLLGGSAANPAKNQSDNNFNPFDDLFGTLGNSASRANNRSDQSAPPTQSGRGGNGNGGRGSSKAKGMLEDFGFNVTESARKGEIDPVIGRDQEITRVIEILNRRTKNNPVLIGEPGVGKTAVVEGLAQKIVDGDVPQKLQNKEVIRLDVVSLVQGTGIRGQFEERMQKLMKEISSRKDVILFIDEIHEIVGADAAGDGNMDAGNILKPALARGELQLVGRRHLMSTGSLKKMRP